MARRSNGDTAASGDGHCRVESEVAYPDHDGDEDGTGHDAEDHRHGAEAACHDGDGAREHAVLVIGADDGEEDGLRDQPVQHRAEDDQRHRDTVRQLEEVRPALRAGGLADAQGFAVERVTRPFFREEHRGDEPVKREVEEAQDDLRRVGDEGGGYDCGVGVLDIGEGPAGDEGIRVHGAEAEGPEVAFGRCGERAEGEAE